MTTVKIHIHRDSYEVGSRHVFYTKRVELDKPYNYVDDKFFIYDYMETHI